MDRRYTLLVILLSIINVVFAQWKESEFSSPSDNAKPQVWYHWQNGHIGKEAITADLESMKNVGIGGFTLFNTSEGIPEGPVKYMSNEWWQLFEHLQKEAKRLNLEMGVMNGAGWSVSGGPWVTPDKAMQEVAWTEKQVEGPMHFDGDLEIPVPALGIERDMQRNPEINKRYYVSRDEVRGFYHDIVIWAFPTPDGEHKENPYHIDQWWGKSGFSKLPNYVSDKKNAPDSEIIQTKQMINLTSKIDNKGHLVWNVPAGKWTILRIGYQPTGVQNHPAPLGGRGLEIDKLSSSAVDFFWEKSIDKMLQMNHRLKEKYISRVLVDSYEAGHQNWTHNFDISFKQKMGYDLKVFLPTITGRVIGSTEMTEKFLWDYRKVISDMLITNFYDRFSEQCHKNGVTFAAEPYGAFGNTNDFSSGRMVDLPAGEFWVKDGDKGSKNTTKLASSIAHLYNRKLVGVEAYTNGSYTFETNPRDIKTQGDYFFCQGINQYWFHCFVHDPYNKLPGMTLGIYGSHFNRRNTWWPYSKDWLLYLARCQYMLQQGLANNDILYYAGEDAPLQPIYREKLKPIIPFGYDYDFCNTEFLDSIKIMNHKIIIPSGAKYSMLVIRSTEYMRPQLLEKIIDLVKRGALVYLEKPDKIPGIETKSSSLSKLKILTSKIWNTPSNQGFYIYGKGRLYSTNDLSFILKQNSILPDFECENSEDIKKEGTLYSGSGLEYIHKCRDDEDMYFISNQQNHHSVNINALFRVENCLPEFWDPMTGKTTVAEEYSKTSDGRIRVKLNLEEAGSVFVVFRKPFIECKKGNLQLWNVVDSIKFTHPWNVTFVSDYGNPSEISMSNLVDLSLYPDSTVRYYSGTIIYNNIINIDSTQLTKGTKFMLDLGQVEVVSEVYLNGKSLGILWKNPYRMDITSNLVVGSNKLILKVANLWVNRLIGDQNLPEDCEWTYNTGSTAKGMGLTKIPDWVLNDGNSPTGRHTFTVWKWTTLKNKKLLPSGLIGPVKVVIKNRK